MRISGCSRYDWQGLDNRFVTNIGQRVARRLAEREIGVLPNDRNTELAAESLLVLNQWCRNQQDSNWRDEIYQMKSDFLHSMYALGYLKPVELCQQVIRCNSCERGVFRRYYDNGDVSYEDSCWHCNGTGVYKRVLLYVFRVKIGDREFMWHQPSDRVGWNPPMTTDYSVKDDAGNWNIDIAFLPQFKEGKTTSPRLSAWEFQRHLLRLAVYVTRYQMFERLQLADWKHALKSDVRDAWQLSKRRLFNSVGWRTQRLLERVGLGESLPF